MTRLLLVRHGETIWNSELRYQGQKDIPLNDIGRAQAERVRERLAHEEFTAVYSSDLERASRTAAVIARGRGVPHECLVELREANFGDWEGLTYAEASARFPDVAKARRDDPERTQPPNGESLAQVRERALAAVDRLLARHADETILISGHGGPLRALLCGLLGLDLRFAWRLRLDNCSLSIVDTYPEGAILSLLNDVYHLRGIEGQSLASGSQT